MGDMECSIAAMQEIQDNWEQVITDIKATVANQEGLEDKLDIIMNTVQERMKATIKADQDEMKTGW
jgi:hypothetical protein